MHIGIGKLYIEIGSFNQGRLHAQNSDKSGYIINKKNKGSHSSLCMQYYSSESNESVLQMEIVCEADCLIVTKVKPNKVCSVHSLVKLQIIDFMENARTKKTILHLLRTLAFSGIMR